MKIKHNLLSSGIFSLLFISVRPISAMATPNFWVFPGAFHLHTEVLNAHFQKLNLKHTIHFDK